jgi:hypothetical protein
MRLGVIDAILVLALLLNGCCLEPVGAAVNGGADAGEVVDGGADAGPIRCVCNVGQTMCNCPGNLACFKCGNGSNDPTFCLPLSAPNPCP